MWLNYQPIVLTSCLCKLHEKLVNDCLMWQLEHLGIYFIQTIRVFMKVVAVPTVLPELIITLTPHLLENNTLSASSFILRRPSIPHGSITFFAVSILLTLVVHYQILFKIFCPVELSRLKSAPLSGQVTHHEGVFSCTFYALL